MAHRVLLVDDDPLVVIILSTLLVAEGWDVVTAGSLAAARPLLATVDALVVDGLLPDGDGLELLEDPVVRERRPRVVLHTGSEPTGPVGVPVVLKGSGPEALLAALGGRGEAAAGHHPPLGPAA